MVDACKSCHSIIGFSSGDVKKLLNTGAEERVGDETCSIEKASADFLKGCAPNHSSPNLDHQGVDPLSTALKVRWLVNKLWQIRFCVSSTTSHL